MGYIEFDHPKYVPMAIDLSGQLLVGERKEIKPLNADGNPSSAGERCHARTGKNNCLDKPWHLMTCAERIDSSTDWRELIDVDDRRVFYNKVTGERWTTILNDLWRARLKAGCYKHILLYGSPRRPRTLHQHETWQQGRVRENVMTWSSPQQQQQQYDTHVRPPQQDWPQPQHLVWPQPQQLGWPQQ